MKSSGDSSDEGSEDSAVSEKRKRGQDTFVQGASSGGRKQRRM